MADLAIGISKTAVEALVNKVKTAIKEEAELWQTVQRDTVFMKDEFDMMQSFLKTADWEQIKNNVGRTWVRQVRDLSYDAEDCIESVLLLDTKSSFWTVWLRFLASLTCNSGTPSPLDQAVAEIKLLKARVEEVSNRNMRYRLINDSGSKSLMPQQLPPISAVGIAASDILAEAWCTSHKQGGSVDLTMLITENSNDLHVISLWGTGGDRGMTSIIKEAYEKPEICQKFSCRAWLKLAHPFKPHEFIQSLADQFYGNSCKGGDINGVQVLMGMEVATCTDLAKEFVQKLKDHRYLVVLEDLSNMAQWHAVRAYLPDNKNGSRIVVSTQKLEVAKLCAGQPHQVLELRKLPDNHSICVFFNKGFKRVEVGIVDGGSSLLQMASNKSVLIGRKPDVDKLLNMISSAGQYERPLVISVWGFPSLGKSVLVKTVLYSQMCNQTSPFNWYGWVDVSYPFILGDFCRRMLSYTFQHSEGVGQHAFMPQQSKPDHEIIQECMKFLQDHQCLIVIDGLRSKEEWDLIKSLIRAPSQSCIVVITAEESVAKYCAEQDDAVYRVKVLGSEAALELFRQEFRGSGSFRDAHMLKQAKYILDKCAGIPEIILALARYLAVQQGDIQQRKLSHMKANFMNELETNPEFVSLRDLFAWMRFKFDALPQCLMTCILYLSVFSEANSIRRRHFVRRWIAEGYSKSTDSKTMEEYASELFNRLTKQTATMGEWRVNSFFHEYINSRLMEERVVFFPLVVSILDGSRNLTKEGLGQHLTIRSSWKTNDEFVFEDLELSHLQSLTVSCPWRPFFVPYEMRSLWVLDLEGMLHVGDDELERILELLPRLRFLSLRGHGQITCLPDSFYRLRHLQTLDIRGTSVVCIEVKKLQKLQYIRAGTTIPWLDDIAKEELTPSNISSRTVILPVHVPQACTYWPS